MASQKIFFKSMNNQVFGKTMENLRKHRNIKLVTTEINRKNYLMLKPIYHGTKFFTTNLLAMIKTQILINKPVFLGLSILELSKIVLYKF